jgi:hypothetical protein
VGPGSALRAEAREKFFSSLLDVILIVQALVRISFIIYLNDVSLSPFFTGTI